METAGAEALSVFPSENPSRHIRISTAKKVCWDFILLNARWWFPSRLLPPLVPVQDRGRAMFLVHRMPCEEFQIALLQQMELGKGYRERAFPEKEPHMIFRNAFYMIKMTVLGQMGIEGEMDTVEGTARKARWGLSTKRGPERDKNGLFQQHLLR